MNKTEVLYNALKEFINEDPYPEDIFLPIPSEQLKQINMVLIQEFKFPIDRLTGHIGRVLRKGIAEHFKQALTSYDEEKPVQEGMRWVKASNSKKRPKGKGYYCCRFKEGINYSTGFFNNVSADPQLCWRFEWGVPSIEDIEWLDESKKQNTMNNKSIPLEVDHTPGKWNPESAEEKKADPKYGEPGFINHNSCA